MASLVEVGETGRRRDLRGSAIYSLTSRLQRNASASVQGRYCGAQIRHDTFAASLLHLCPVSSYSPHAHHFGRLGGGVSHVSPWSELSMPYDAFTGCSSSDSTRVAVNRHMTSEQRSSMSALYDQDRASEDRLPIQRSCKRRKRQVLYQTLRPMAPAQ